MPDPTRKPKAAPTAKQLAASPVDRFSATMPVGLQAEDLNRVLERFGVSEAQVRRDHAISLILAGLSDQHRHELLFFGGTALSRTYLEGGRLSEDIDLIARGVRNKIAQRVKQTIEQSLQRSHGRVTWTQDFSANSDIEPAIASVPNNIAIQVQILRAEGYEPWPSAEHEIEQRYRDVRRATLLTPTLPSFVGWKTSAWVERAASRDLYDLWALARLGALDAQAAALFAKHRPTGAAPRSWMFTKAPSESDWQAQLAGQTRLTVTAAAALATVNGAWAKSLGAGWQ